MGGGRAVGAHAGQCFVGDQTQSRVMRVALETVNGVYQGACFPFREGLQCGVNRLTFGPGVVAGYPGAARPSQPLQRTGSG